MFGFNVNKSDSRSNSFSNSSDYVFNEGVQNRIHQNAYNAAMQMDTRGLATEQQALFSGGLNAIGSLLEQSSTSVNANNYLAQRMSGENPALQGQIDSIGSDLGKFFNEQLMPGITSSAAGSGQLGGGRQGVAQGAAIDATSREFSSAVSNLRAQDLQARDAAALGIQANSAQSLNSALAAMPGLSQSATNVFTAEMAPYAALSEILGGPTVLNNSTSTGRSKSSSFGFGVNVGAG